MKNFFTSETFLGIIASIIICILLFLVFLWATAPEQWYANMHTEGCNGTNNCGCYEKLIELDKQR